MDVAVLPPLDLSKSSIKTRENFYSHRPQMLTGDLLKVLYQHLPPDAFAMMGITMTDLYPGPGWNYVFGQAAPRSAVGVYSFARYDSQFSARRLRRHRAFCSCAGRARFWLTKRATCLVSNTASGFAAR